MLNSNFRLAMHDGLLRNLLHVIHPATPSETSLLSREAVFFWPFGSMHLSTVEFMRFTGLTGWRLREKSKVSIMSERATTNVFGVSLAAVFVGILILTAVSY